ncbi:V-type proton ATPase subunit F [Symbiodinium microadriaticum]|uniref:V-type proton ATPase subunit F n=2 Tax=Symbiodinium TaxID=2949 RepID=A0A1Q9C990_SYMMI|nr:V-type proton ATPase subunit F [Symbiodinium microadriaticum]
MFCCHIRSADMVKTKVVTQNDMKIGLIGDEDTVTGMLLAGVGHVDGQGKKNFLVVDSKVHIKDIEDHFNDLTTRKDISMILITQDSAELIRRAVDEFANSGQMVPTVLEIPSKDTPYDARKDGVMQRVAFFLPSAMAALGVEV